MAPALRSSVMGERPAVVIVGAGFAGLTAARSLGRAPVNVVVIDRNNYHLFTPLLYQVASGLLDPSEIARPVRALLRRSNNTEFRLAEVTGLDLAGKRVLTDHGPVGYDHLILAAGSANSYFGIAGLAERSHSIKTLGEALSLRNHVLAAFEEAVWEADPARRKALLSFVVVGGGPTGVEYAGALSELVHLVLSRDHPHLEISDTRIVLIEAAPRLLGAFDPSLSDDARRRLQKKGVEVRLGTAVKGVDAEVVSLAAGDHLAAHTVVWTAGVEASRLVSSLTREPTRQGTVRVAPDLSLPGHPEVYAIGDLAHVEQDGRPLPMLAPVAQQEARHVARSIAAKARGGTFDRPFRYLDKGIMATIGRNAAVVELGPIKIDGFVGWLIWLFLHLALIVTFRSRVITLINWAWDYFLFDRPVRLIVKAQEDPPREGRAQEGPTREGPKESRPGRGRGRRPGIRSGP